MGNNSVNHSKLQQQRSTAPELRQLQSEASNKSDKQDGDKNQISILLASKHSKEEVSRVN